MLLIETQRKEPDVTARANADLVLHTVSDETPTGRASRRAAEDVKRLEDAIRDMLDFAVGWGSDKMTESARLGAIHFHGSAALQEDDRG